MSNPVGDLTNWLGNPLNSSLVGLLGGFVLGIIGSIIVWRIQVHIAPKVVFRNIFTKVKAEEMSVGFKYKIKFWNAGRRAIIDAEIFARLKIKNLDQNPKTSGNHTYFSIPLGYDRLPIILPQQPRRNIPDRYNVSKDPPTHTHLTLLKVAEIEELKDPTYAKFIMGKLGEKNEELRKKFEELKQKLMKELKEQNQKSEEQKINATDVIQKDPDLLEHLLTLGDDAWLEIAIFGYDQFSGTRKVFPCIYTLEDLKQGPFKKDNLTKMKMKDEGRKGLESADVTAIRDAAIKWEKQFAKNGYTGEHLGLSLLRIEGSTPVVLSAPHAVKHYRRGRSDPEDADIYTGALAIQLASLTKASALIYARTSKEDPNDDTDGEYKRQLRDLVTQKQARFVLDFHGLAQKHPMQIAVGTGGNRENLLGRTDLLDVLRNTLENAEFEIAEDAPGFAASRSNTISSFTRRELGIPALQIEMHKDYRDPRNKPDAYVVLLRALDEAIQAIAEHL